MIGAIATAWRLRRWGCVLVAAVLVLAVAAAFGVLMAATQVVTQIQRVQQGVALCEDGGGAGASGGSVDQAAASDLAENEIPENYLQYYKDTGKAWDVDWTLLAAVGWKESTHGQDPNSRVVNDAGALGPMQFIPAAWRAHGLPAGKKEGDPPPLDKRLDPETAIWSAAHKLTDQGARSDPREALVRYYGADVDGYADSVLAKAGEYREGDFSAAPADADADAGADADQADVAVDCGQDVGGGSGGAGAPGYSAHELSGQDPTACDVAGSPFSTGSITPITCAGHKTIVKEFGSWLRYGGNCYRSTEDGGEHPRGRACDYMTSPIGTMPSVRQEDRGDQIAAYAKEHADKMGVLYVIWKQRIWSPARANEGWRDMDDRGGVTNNHWDHVHISYVP